MKKRGVVRFVSRYGSVKFSDEDKWYMPTDDAKQYVTPDMAGRWVEITLLEGVDRFTFIRETTDNPDKAGIEPVTPRRPDKDLQIVRQSSLRAAAMFCTAHPDILRTPEKLIQTADQFTNWVMKE